MTKIVKKVKGILEKAKIFMFPSQLKVVLQKKEVQKNLKANGGWGDHRDHSLCMNIRDVGLL